MTDSIISLTVNLATNNKKQTIMTKEEFEKRMSALYEKRVAITREMKNLQDEYVSNYPIKPGDKCVDEQGRICWLCRISFWNSSSTSPQILVNYTKMDGTRSKREQYAYGEVTKV